ncbi:MAG TPA: hypothetical protein DDZ84_06655 [Firmicutes bacterium]|nr:hypothetical protein [Bacillota bacterium]
MKARKTAHLAVAVCVTFALLLAGPSWRHTARLVPEPTARAIAQANRPDAYRMYDARTATAFARLLYSYRGFADELSRKEAGGAPVGSASRPSTISLEDAAREVDWIFRVLKYGRASHSAGGSRRLRQLLCRRSKA